MVDVRHVHALGLALDRILGLLLRADEEDGAVPLREVADELRGLVEALARLRQIDDVDAGPLGEDEAAHLWIPATCLVTEVHSGLQQVAHAGDCHLTPLWFWLRCSGGARGAPASGAGTVARGFG